MNGAIPRRAVLTVVQAILAVGGLALLLSPGGAGIYAAPVLLALYFWAALHAPWPGRLGWSLMAAATGAEAAWGGAYQLWGEAGRNIVIAPAVTGVVVLLVFVRATTRYHQAPAAL
jgi:hypothetical protein